MAEAAKPRAPRKAPAKKAPAKTETQVEDKKKSIISDIEEKVREVADEVKADVEKSVEAVKEKVDPMVEEIKGKTVEELKAMHLQALYAEDAIKRELYVLRLRAANMATTVSDDVDKEIADLKAKAVEAAAWLKIVESGLAGELRDIWGTKY